MQITSLSAKQWANTLSIRKVIIASNRDITAKPFLFGEDYYLSSIVNELKEKGIHVDLAIFEKGKICFNKLETLTNLSQVIDELTLVMLHNVSPFHIVKAKFFKKVKVIVPLYYFWNNSLSRIQNVKEIIGDLLWQPFIDEFIISSPNEIPHFKRVGILRKITSISPSYNCPYCSLVENQRKKEMLAHRLPTEVRAVYIGSLKPKRFPLGKILTSMNSNPVRKWTLTVYTMSQTEFQSFRAGNVEVSIVQRALTEKEKCNILRQAHVFVAPAKNTTMQPPLSVIEAEYHGNLVIKN